ncbi:hypothetical protein MNR01_16600 [Lysobacter sp. S4-A87]|uniref:hypothetical protein n=1 Tax=Lysobacter sp. S4-A87 TaxID=2925843 RepID=UPI001F53C14C|nr:hypothetical protein [Lysobacter sp. S4-A87]UNK49320.1 hypothetical protein MNR01_16600 [Lysobacter sp. S4-A87]
MNASLRMVVLVSVCGLAACAGMESKSTYVPEQKKPSIMDNDEAYIAYVERVARRRGIEVVWVNSPRKSEAQVAQESGQ